VLGRPVVSYPFAADPLRAIRPSFVLLDRRIARNHPEKEVGLETKASSPTIAGNLVFSTMKETHYAARHSPFGSSICPVSLA
ncbi:MAG: hypothetical protein Q4D92_08225, partial [Slackia sp.]|nr:hypothetical protein [Slackia sp.]